MYDIVNIEDVIDWWDQNKLYLEFKLVSKIVKEEGDDMEDMEMLR